VVGWHTVPRETVFGLSNGEVLDENNVFGLLRLAKSSKIGNLPERIAHLRANKEGWRTI